MKSLHVMHAHRYSEMVPIPVVFYLTEEVMEDAEAVPHEAAAKLLLRDLAHAVEYFRNERNAGVGEGRASAR